MKTWFWRHELEWLLERDIKDFLSFQKKPISVDKIEEKYIRYSEICNKYWLSNFHKEKYRKNSYTGFLPYQSIQLMRS